MNLIEAVPGYARWWFGEALVAGIAVCYSEAGSVAVDLGAHVGHHTRSIATGVGSDGVVLAVEPQPLLAKLLREQFSAPVEVIECAVSSEGGRAPLQIPRHAPGFAAIRTITGLPDAESNSDFVDVEVKTLDQIVASRGRVSFIKMDIEGQEIPALSGGRRCIERDRPIIVMEASDEERARQNGWTHADGFQLAASVDYRILNLRGGAFTRPEDLLGVDNLILAPAERVAELASTLPSLWAGVYGSIAFREVERRARDSSSVPGLDGRQWRVDTFGFDILFDAGPAPC